MKWSKRPLEKPRRTPLTRARTEDEERYAERAARNLQRLRKEFYDRQQAKGSTHVPSG